MHEYSHYEHFVDTTHLGDVPEQNEGSSKDKSFLVHDVQLLRDCSSKETCAQDDRSGFGD